MVGFIVFFTAIVWRDLLFATPILLFNQYNSDTKGIFFDILVVG